MGWNAKNALYSKGLKPGVWGEKNKADYRQITTVKTRPVRGSDLRKKRPKEFEKKARKTK